MPADALTAEPAERPATLASMLAMPEADLAVIVRRAMPEVSDGGSAPVALAAFNSSI